MKATATRAAVVRSTLVFRLGGLLRRARSWQRRSRASVLARGATVAGGEVWGVVLPGRVATPAPAREPRHGVIRGSRPCPPSVDLVGQREKGPKSRRRGLGRAVDGDAVASARSFAAPGISAVTVAGTQGGPRPLRRSLWADRASPTSGVAPAATAPLAELPPVRVTTYVSADLPYVCPVDVRGLHLQSSPSARGTPGVPPDRYEVVTG